MLLLDDAATLLLPLPDVAATLLLLTSLPLYYCLTSLPLYYCLTSLPLYYCLLLLPNSAVGTSLLHDVAVSPPTQH